MMNCSYPAELTSFTPWRLTRKGSKQQQLLDLVGCRSACSREAGTSPSGPIIWDFPDLLAAAHRPLIGTPISHTRDA